jgi:uncharacterized protein (TIGR00725 family)
MRGPFIGVIGAGCCEPAIEDLAAEVGREVARHDAVLVCGGLGGVMTAAARGAKEVGGFTIGILPGASIREANPYIDFPVATNMGHARNAVIVQTADVMIAIDGGFGTLSEIALALKVGKCVIAIQSRFSLAGVYLAQNAREAVERALASCRAV